MRQQTSKWRGERAETSAKGRACVTGSKRRAALKVACVALIVNLPGLAWAQVEAAPAAAPNSAQPNVASGTVAPAVLAPPAVASTSATTPTVQVSDACPPAQSWTMWPERLRYIEGEPTPTGYVIDEEPVAKVWIPGMAVSLAPYLIGLAAASVDDFRHQSGWLAVPVLGPWITLAVRDRGGPSENAQVRTGLIIDGVMQATGVALIAGTILLPRRVLVRRDVARVSWTPTLTGSGGYGVAAVGRF